MNLRYEEIELLSYFLPKKHKVSNCIDRNRQIFRDAHMPKFLVSLTSAGESLWLLNNQQFLKHKIDNARHITLHRDSIIVLGHFVHRAFDLEAPIKHDDRRHHLIYQTR